MNMQHYVVSNLHSVSQKKIPPATCGFLTFFHKWLRILNHFYTPAARSYLR